MIRYLSILILAALLTSCYHHAPMPGPLGARGAKGAMLNDSVGTDDVARFELVASYETGDDNFNEVINKIKEGDLVALWMTKEQTRRGFLNVRFSAFAYVVLEYGHLGIAVKVPDREPPIRLYSSLPKIGSCLSGGLDELKDKNFRIFRLDRWDELSAERLREFVSIARKRSRTVFGYDYLAAGGVWSNHLEPRYPDQIVGGYMCSTSVAAALHYAGLDLKKVGSCAAFQIVGPKRVFTSEGRIMDQ